MFRLYRAIIRCLHVIAYLKYLNALLTNVALSVNLSAAGISSDKERNRDVLCRGDGRRTSVNTPEANSSWFASLYTTTYKAIRHCRKAPRLTLTWAA
jgi:hypothetical protein